MNSLSLLRRATAQIGSCTEIVGGSRILMARCSSTETVHSDDGFKGHGMLAPFTAGWQTSDSHPLVIEKSKGSYVYDTNGKKYLDSLAGLWCTSLEMMETEGTVAGEDDGRGPCGRSEVIRHRAIDRSSEKKTISTVGCSLIMA